MASGGSNKSSSKQAPAKVWEAQAPYLTDLYQQAQGMNQSAGNAAGYDALSQAQGYGQQLQQGAQQALTPDWLKSAQGSIQGMQQSGQEAIAGGLDRLLNPQQQYQQAMQQVGPGNNPALGAYARNIGQQFNEQIMPALQGQAIQAGGLGGSRQGLAQATAANQAGQRIQDFGAQLYGQDMDRVNQLYGMNQQSAGNLYGQGMQGMQGAGALGSQVYGQGMQGALGAQSGALDTGSFGMGVPWYNLQQYAGILGSPTVLSGGGKSSSSGWNASVLGG